ncbi:MAG: CCA tRNA nucleotidyltransferase [Eubacteriales bacterium]|nr:CCA tRNA nucleotidyltransferase [Eubacteriales bacterium]
MKQIPLPIGLKKLSEIFIANGYPLFLVGGYVRNITLGISGGDVDVCSSARPDEAAHFLRAAGLNVIEKAPSLGTIEAHLEQDGKKLVFEHTTFRRDFYPQGGEHRPDKVEFTDNINEDAGRRDFTVNALYLDIRTGRIIDPTKKGIDDIRKKVIRAAAHDPDETIRDDGLRIMRLARFAAELRFFVCPDLMACATKRAGLLDDISAERKRDELIKILMADTKYPSLGGMEYPHEYGLALLRQAGALAHILPVLNEGDGVEQAKQYHQYDVLGHCIRTCAVSRPVLPLRLAALLHDIGKPRALRHGGNMYGHESLGEALAGDEMNALKFDSSTKNIVLTLVRNHMFDLEGKAKPKTVRRRAIMLGRGVFELLIALRRADFMASRSNTGDVISADNWQRELERMIAQGVPWTIKDLAVTGSDIMSALDIAPSPKVGKILDMLFNECVAHPNINNFETLKKRAKTLAHLLP